MRGRTLLASATIALLTLVWSAPAALAAPDEDDPKPPASTATVRSGSEQGDKDDDREKDNSRETETETPTTTKPKPKPTEAPTEPPAEPPATATFTESPRPLPEPVRSTPATSSPSSIALVPVPEASLSVAPKTVRPGDVVTANAQCLHSTRKSLTGEGVSFNGNQARIGEDTAAGSHTVTLVCSNGQREVQATDSFTVERAPEGPAPQARLAVSPKEVRPGDVINSGAVCEGGEIHSLTSDVARFRGTSGRVYRHAQEGEYRVNLVCRNGQKESTASDTFRVVRGPGVEPKAVLSVSPKVVKQGGYIWANGGCVEGVEESLSAEGVRFRGNRGWVDDDAHEGEHTVKRVCRLGDKTDEATDTFRVERGDGWHGEGPRDFWMSDRSGYRGDEIHLSVRCRDDHARVESNALDDVTLRRDGSRLTGTTHVEHDADRGWHRVTVYCDGNQASRGFWVNWDHDHAEYLDLDPAYGYPGDEIDVNVGCDWSVGRVESDALVDTEVHHHGRPWRYHATTHVEEDAEPGEHTVKIRCGDDTLEETFFVRSSDDRDNDDAPSGGEYVSVYPKGGVETGGGPVSDAPLGAVALGVTALASAGLAGMGIALARRSVRR